MPNPRSALQLTVAAALAALAACSSSAPVSRSPTSASIDAPSPPVMSPTPTDSPYEVPLALRRPLRMPSMPSNGHCPVTPSRQVHPAFANAAGPGPVYPVGGGGNVMFFPQLDEAYRSPRPPSTEFYRANPGVSLMRSA
jgi:hypothetical protein